MRYTFLILLALSCSPHLSLEATRVNQPEKYDFDVPGQLPLSQRQRGEDGFGFQLLTSRPLPTPIGKMPSAPKDFESASRTELRLTARLKYYAPPEAAVLFFDEIGMLQDKSPEEAERIGLAMIPRLTSLELFGVKAKQTPAEFNLAVQEVHQETIDQLDDSEARIDQLVQQIAVTLQAQIDNDRANGNKQDEILGDCCGVQQRMQSALLTLATLKPLCTGNPLLASNWNSCSQEVQTLRRNYFFKLEEIRFAVELGRQLARFIGGEDAYYRALKSAVAL